MKKKVFLIGVSCLLLCGCGKVPKLSNGNDAVVSFKDNEMISVDDFYKEIKDSFGLSTLVNMIDKYIYEKEFSDKITEAKNYADTAEKQMRSQYETEAELLQMLSYYRFQTVEAYHDYVYLNYLQNEAIKAYVSNNISEKELKDYYENSVYPNMNISAILITSKATDSMSADEKKAKEDEAKKEVEKIIEELNKAKKNKENISEVFARLAKEKSEDTSSKDNGGDLGEININSMGSKYDELVKEAAKLKDGEYSTKVITTQSGYYVILKTKTGEKKSYDDSVSSMKESITTDKLTKDSSLSIEAIKSYREKYNMNIQDDELQSQYGKYMNNLINNAKSSK